MTNVGALQSQDDPDLEAIRQRRMQELMAQQGGGKVPPALSWRSVTVDCTCWRGSMFCRCKLTHARARKLPIRR